MAGPQCNTSGPNDVVDQQGITQNSIPISQSPVKSTSQKITNPYERAGTILGTYLAVLLGIGLLCGVIFISGGLPVVLTLLFGVIGCPKYIGCAADCILEIKNGKSSTNKKIANLCGCVAGLVVFVLSFFCPTLNILTSSINAFIQSPDLSLIVKLPALFMGLIGTAGAAADKIGLIIDGFTKQTIVDVFHSIKNKLKSLFVKDISDKYINDKSNDDVQSVKEPLLPQQIQVSTNEEKKLFKILNFDNYEKKSSVLGFVIAAIVFGLILGGIITIPGFGPPLAISLIAACIGIPKYIGKGIDCKIDKSVPTNQKVGTLLGCVVGFVIGIVTICCPSISVITSSINALVQSSSFNFIEKIPLILFGLAGTVGAAADKIGLLVDCFTSYTIIDACRFLKRKIPIFNKKRDISNDTSDVKTETKLEVNPETKPEIKPVPSPQKLPDLAKVVVEIIPDPLPSKSVEFNKEKRLSDHPAGFFNSTNPENIPELALEHPHYLEHQPAMIPSHV